MGYTWEQVMLGIDSSAEADKKRRQQQDILDKQAEEAEMAQAWGLGLSLLGAALGLGPLGMAAGKIIGRYGADWGWFGGDYSDWETDVVDIGKFDKAGAEEFRKTRDKAIKDQDKGQALNTLTDLASMYVSSGGLTSDPGGWDPTTFGGGKGEWSLYGRGDAPIDITKLSADEYDRLYATGVAAPGGIIPASADYVPSIWEQGFTSLAKVTGGVGFTKSKIDELVD